MATQHRLTNSQYAAMRRSGRIGRGGQSRNSGTQRSSGRMKIEIDVSDLTSRLQGITFENIKRLPEFRKKSLHHGLKARDSVRTNVRSKLTHDRRQAYRSVVLGFSTRQNATLFVNITSTDNTETKKWDRPGRKRRDMRSNETKRIDNYFGRSRAFILRFINSGTQERFVGKNGRWNRGAKSYDYKKKHGYTGSHPRRGSIPAGNFFYKLAKDALLAERDLWLEDTKKIIEDTFRK